MNKKTTLIFNIVCFVVPLIIIGFWMILGERPEDRAYEKASYSAMKAIWGPPAGLTILIFGVFLLVTFILKFRRDPKPKRPELSFLIYDYAFPIFLYSAFIFVTILLQNVLVQSGVLPAIFEHGDTSSINLIFVTVIFVFGVATLVLKLMNRKKK